jgi:hypothetical protein
VTKLDTESPVISLDPNAASKATTVKRSETSTGSRTRSGALEYEYRGEWIGSRALLQAAVDNAEPIAVKRDASFRKALETGNGVSNYAGDIAKELNLPKREKAADE